MEQSRSPFSEWRQLKRWLKFNQSPPAWVDVLAAAKEWSTPPWKIAGGSRVMWWFRYQALHRAITLYTPKSKEQALGEQVLHAQLK